MIKWFFVCVTWFGAIIPREQEIEQANEADCERFKAVVESNWARADEEGFVGVAICKPVKIKK